MVVRPDVRNLVAVDTNRLMLLNSPYQQLYSCRFQCAAQLNGPVNTRKYRVFIVSMFCHDRNGVSVYRSTYPKQDFVPVEEFQQGAVAKRVILVEQHHVPPNV